MDRANRCARNTRTAHRIVVWAWHQVKVIGQNVIRVTDFDPVYCDRVFGKVSQVAIDDHVTSSDYRCGEDRTVVRTSLEKPKRSRVWLMDLPMDAFLGDRTTQVAVGMCFITLGNALNRVKSGSPELAARLPELRDAIGFRNILAHDYEAVEPGIVWRIACDSLPEPKRKAVSLISELEAAPGARRTVAGRSQ